MIKRKYAFLISQLSYFLLKLHEIIHGPKDNTETFKHHNFSDV